MVEFLINRLYDVIGPACNAPSGDNAQPWKFLLKGGVLHLINLPERDKILYNFRQRGSLIAHGALLQNIRVAARYLGMEATIWGLPNNHSTDSIAAVSLEKTTLPDTKWFLPMGTRVTNRKPYGKTPLSVTEIRKLEAAFVFDSAAELKFVTEAAEIQKIARALSLNERLIFENAEIHRALFDMIRWTRKEETDRPGLYVKTLEFNPVQTKIFRLAGNERLVAIANKIGFSKFIAGQSRKLYEASGAIGGIIMEDLCDRNFVLLGEAFERLWLEATLLGLSVHPVTALVYLAQRIFAGEDQMIEKGHRALILEAYDVLRRAFAFERGALVMLFRIGHGEDPSAKSSKLSPVIYFEE